MKPVIIVDDEIELLDAMSEYLMKHNIKAKAFTDGRKALKFIENNNISAAIIDLSMPEINGIEVIGNIRKINKNLPIIAMSGMDWKDTLLEGALISGANRSLKKPFSLIDLLNTINELVINE